MDKSFIHVPVLRTADDLPAWRRAVRLLCLSHDVWGNVTGDNVRPDDPALVRLFLKDDRKAQAILQSTLALNLTQIVQNTGTALETMVAIEAHFADESLTNKVFLKKSLFKIQQHDTMSCLDLTSQIAEISDQLTLMDFQILPLDLVIILLAALHPRFDVWVEQIEKLDEDQLTWGIITKKLYREESRISRVTERVEAMVLIPVLGSSKPASKVLVQCDYCKKVGHLKACCWKYQKDLKLKRKNAKPSSAKDVALLVSEESVSASDEEEEF